MYNKNILVEVLLMATLTTKIKFRRDTAANLSTIILAEGEPAYATDTKKFAVGDGESTFANLKDCCVDTIPSVQCETAAATAAKVGSCTNHTLAAKSYVHVNIRYTNTAKSAITLNIDGAGAKPIYLNGSATSSSNYSLTAGTYIAYYDGTNFYFRTDGKLTADITGAAGKVTNKMTIKLNGGTTEGTNLFTYDGSAAKTINITPASIGAASTTALSDLAARVQALESIPAYAGAYQEV